MNPTDKNSYKVGDVVKYAKDDNLIGYVLGFTEDNKVEVLAYQHFWEDPERPSDVNFIWPNVIQPIFNINKVRCDTNRGCYNPEDLERISNPDPTTRMIGILEGYELEISVEGENYGKPVWVYSVVNGGRLNGPDILLCMTKGDDPRMILLLSDMVRPRTDVVKPRIPVKDLEFISENIDDVRKTIDALDALRYSLERLMYGDLEGKEAVTDVQGSLSAAHARITRIMQFKGFRCCKRCGRVFIPSTPKNVYCDTPDANGIPCYAVGYDEIFKSKLNNDESLRSYNRAYKTMHARYRKGRITRNQFNAWRDAAKNMLDKVRAGTISYNEFRVFLDNK